jgi:outer membrane protein
MSYSRRTRLLAAVCSAGLLTGLAAAAHAESLADAIALAYQTNPTLQGQRALQRALDESIVAAKTGLRPDASVQASITTSRFDPEQVLTPNPYNTSSATLSINQPIYTGGRVSAGISAAQADVLAGRENLRRVESNVLGSVIQAYVDVRRDQESLRISQENVTVLSRQLEETKARFEVGELTRTDTAQAEARLAQAQASLSSAQAQLAISRASYAAVVGQSPGTLEPEPALATLLPATVDDAFDAAEKNNAQVLAADYVEQASRARVAQAKAQYLPTLSLQASAGAQGFGPSGHSPFNNSERALTASAVATIPLFTGGLTESNIRAAKERNNADRVAIESARRTVLQSVSQAWNQLLGARAVLISNEEQVRASTVAFEGVRQEAQVGLRTTLDVLNAEQELRGAELALANAKHDEYVAAAAVLSSVGKLEARNLVPATPIYDPKTSFDKLSHAWGWVPWEPVIHALDKVLAPSEGPAPADVPVATAK